ncbi:hypothetical protein GCM10009845_38770 [Pedococcus bigeumensis]
MASTIHCLNVVHTPGQDWRLHGISFTQLRGPIRSSRQQGLAWLEQGDTNAVPVSVMWDLANFYERAGRPRDARAVRYRAQVKLARKHRRWDPRRWSRQIIGFGYYPFRVVAVLFALVLLGTALAWSQQTHFQATGFVGSSSNLVRQQVTADVCPVDVSCFNPVAYSADTVIPAIDFGGQDSWRLDRTAGLAAAAFVGLKVLGWAATTLLVAGIGGLLRRSS